MPELPDVVVYREALERFVVGRELRGVRVVGVSLLKSFDPPISAVDGRAVVGTQRMGKRLVLEMDGADELFLVIHLMVAGRLRWRDQTGAKPPGKIGLAAFDFDHGTLVLTEASKRKKASLWLVRGADALAEQHDRGGVKPLEVDEAGFRAALTSRNRTLKRALCDPTTFSGIGNAYSDEILFHAELSPVQRTGNLDNEEVARLYEATRTTLVDWTEYHRQSGGRRLPRQGHRLPRRHGRPRQVQPALPGVRGPRPAHRLRGQRGQLLPPMPNRRPHPRRPLPLPPPQRRLAPQHRRPRRLSTRLGDRDSPIVVEEVGT